MFLKLKYFWQLFFIFIVIVIQYNVWFGTTGVISLQSVNNKSRLQETNIHNLMQSNTQLRDQIKLLHANDIYMQNYIRYQLNMVASEEIFYQFIE